MYQEVAFRTKRKLPDNDDTGSSEAKSIPTGRRLVEQRDRKTLDVGAHAAPGVMVFFVLLAFCKYVLSRCCFFVRVSQVDGALNEIV